MVAITSVPLVGFAGIGTKYPKGKITKIPVNKWLNKNGDKDREAKMARVPKELTQRRIKGLNKIRNDLRIQFKEITELGIYIEQPMLEIHKNLDEILIRLGYVQKEPYSGLERRKNIQTMDGKRCRII